jgi:hypothetical protein
MVWASCRTEAQLRETDVFYRESGKAEHKVG